MSGNCEDPTKRSVKVGVRTYPANYQPLSSTSFHGRNTFGQNIPHDSDNSSDFDVWVAPNISDVKPDQGAIPKVKPAGGIFQKAWKDFHVSIKRKTDMKILEQCSCKESDLRPVKMQYLLNFHFKELETALCDELLKLKWNVKCVIPGDQCLSIEVKNYTDESVLENVILLLSDELYKVNYFQSMQASKHPELLLKEYIDRGYLAIYMDDEKVFVVGMVDNPKKVNEILRKKPTSSDYSSTSAYKMDVQLDNPFKCRLLIYLQFLPTMRQKHPSVNVAMDEERSIMSICGNNLVDVHAAVEDVDIFIKDFTVEDIELDPFLTQLIKLPDIQTFLKKLCEEQDLKVIWTLSEFNNSITCHCKDRKAVQDFIDVLQHNLEKKTYRYSKQSFGDKAIIFSTTNMFSDFLKKYDRKRLVSTVEGNSMHIFTTRGIGNKLALLEVNFEGTKIDIQKNLTQNEKKEIHDQKSEVTITDDGIERIDGTKRWLNVEDIFDVVRGKINPSLKLENEVRAECIKQNMKYDEDTMEVEGTLEQLTSLRLYLITRFGVERGLVNLEQKQETLPDDPDIKHHHDNPSSGNSDSNKAQTTVGKFQKQYIADKDLRIKIVQEDITKMTVDIIVCPQDELCLSKGGIAKAISKVSNEWYRGAVLNMKRVNKCEVQKIKALPATLPFKGVLHTVVPRWDNHAIKDNKTFEKELKLTIRNIVQHCSDSGTVNSVAIPVLGIGADGLPTPYVTYASILANEISKAMKSDKFSLTEIYIVAHEWSMASAIADHFDTVDSFKKVTPFKGRNRNKDKKVVKAGDKEQSKDDFQASGNRGDVKLDTTVRYKGLEDCVICMDKPTAPRKLRCGHIFCEECIDLLFKFKLVCPTCGSIQGIVTGDQPPGQIKVFSSRASLPGYSECGRIEIEYTIYDGQQGAEHPNPGRSFEGIKRTAYLPDNARGQLIAKLLKVAFERRLVFTIGHCRTTGKKGVVTWNDILHKTNPQSRSQFGYPDPTYFDRVIDELAAKGVTEKDL